MMPKHWEITVLDDLFDSRLGKMLSPAAKVGLTPRPYLANKNVQWGKVSLENLGVMDFKDEELDKLRLRQGDVLVCEGGEVGRTAIWRDEISECYYQKAIHRLRPRDHRMTPEFFLYHMMNAFLIQHTYGVPGTQTTIAHLPGVNLKALKIPLPSRHDQDQITRCLTSIDHKIEGEETRKAALQELFRTMLHLLMTGQLRAKDLNFDGSPE